MSMQLRSSTPVARKAHRCNWCYTTIRPGTRYHRSTNVFDDRLYDWVACFACDTLLPEVWDWCYRPSEGVGEDSYIEWSHDHDDRADACAYLDRRGCMCERCENRRAAERLLKAAVREAREIIDASGPGYIVALDGTPVSCFWAYDREAVVQMLAEATRAADLLLKGRPE